MNKLLLLAVVALAASCKEKFISPVPQTATGYLVIEGVVNSEGDNTNIRLSRTTTLDSTGRKLELGAFVVLEDSRNVQLQFAETSAGSYTINNLGLDTSLKYRLLIKTKNNEAYQSDFVKVVPNPAIDSISWERNEKGVQLFVNTHNPANNSRYYQWEFNETWEFRSPIAPSLKWVKTTGPNNSEIILAAFRDTTDPQISRCWQFDASTTIITGSSARLSQDVIHLPVQQIPDASVKISFLYSILLKQYTWTKEGYEFLDKMRKNTESVGSVFDAQPSELSGNIHCTTNPSLKVIGFFNICPFKEKRIFINRSELTGWNYRTDCAEFEIPNNSDSIQRRALGTLPTNAVKTMGPFSIISLNVAPPICVDCTLSGTNVKPVYWP